MNTLNHISTDNMFAVAELNESDLDGVSGGASPAVIATIAGAVAIGAAAVKLAAEVVRYVEYHTPEKKVIKG
jgi:lactobin A/cerein 7B family class IIb bacteriocin